MKERVSKIISSHGAASRREADELIKAGRVTVNGEMAVVGQSADSDKDEISIDGKTLRNMDERLYIMLNKPRGYVTTMKDEQGRRNVSELVSDCGARVYPIGRLDMYSEGLLLFTNDGEFANAVAHPSHENDRTYIVRVRGDISEAVEKLSRPLEIDGYTIRPAKAVFLGHSEDSALISLTIHEGRNRQIRKMCALCGLKVTSLKRVSEGGVKLGKLKTGQWRRLTPKEIDMLMPVKQVRLEHAIFNADSIDKL